MNSPRRPVAPTLLQEAPIVGSKTRLPDCGHHQAGGHRGATPETSNTRSPTMNTRYGNASVRRHLRQAHIAKPWQHSDDQPATNVTRRDSAEEISPRTRARPRRHESDGRRPSFRAADEERDRRGVVEQALALDQAAEPRRRADIAKNPDNRDGSVVATIEPSIRHAVKDTPAIGSNAAP